MANKGIITMTIAISCLLLTFGGYNVIGQTKDQAKREAELAWNALVAAKGGREKLKNVNSIIRRWSTMTELNVLPNYQWTWGLHLFGGPAFIIITDGPKGICTVANEKGVTDVIRSDEYTTRFLPRDVLTFMLETRWYKPELVQVSRQLIGKRKVDVIQTLVGGARIDFVYEPEEMMVREVWFYYEGSLIRKYGLGEYKLVDGIWMPHKFSVVGAVDRDIFSIEIKPDTPVTFEFNVDYDPKIFEPPFKATTADAWKRKP
ncbi:MAG: hypothetical protein ABL952_04260 [Pyrinomonadaceae bacterium]